MAKPFWFPFYPGDFLASSKVALMTTEEIGCYFLLLCHAWQDPMCSLQNDDEILKKLSRFSGNLDAVKACFTQKNGRLINNRMYGEWVKSKKIRRLKRKAGVMGMMKRWGNIELTPVITEDITKNNQLQSQLQLQKEEEKKGMQGEARSVQKRSRAALCDVEWVQSLRENPAYAGIDIDLQFRRASVWYPEHNRQLTRRAFVNWLIREMGNKPMVANKDTSTCQERVQRGAFLKPCGEPSVVQIGGQPRCQTHKEAYESRISRTAT
jgi:uncharacterized protein YdaU (DUF1376 family)